MKNGTARAVLVNAGNANACTGEQGDRDNRIAGGVGQPSSQHSAGCRVMTASTGIIGHLMPMDKLEAGTSRRRSENWTAKARPMALPRAGDHDDRYLSKICRIRGRLRSVGRAGAVRRHVQRPRE